MARHLSVRLAGFGYLLPVTAACRAVEAAMASGGDDESLAQSLLIETFTRLAHHESDAPRAAMIVLSEG